MSIPGSASPLLLASTAAAGGYQVSRSLRFNSADSAYLSRTPAVAGNRRTFTWAGWIKRCKLGSRQSIFSAGTGNLSGDPGGGFYFNSTTDTLSVVHGGTTSADLTTAQVFRDVSAWFHLVVAYDTTQGTPSNSTKIYVNGSQVTISGTYLSSNFQTDFNNTVIHGVGTRTDDGPLPVSTGDFYLADIHFIDGQQLTPSSFTEVSATTGQLIPKAYTGTYGTNGFQLKFADNSSNTAATLGKDTSGNSNNWTPNNLSVTAGAGNDSLVDTPTSYGTDTGVGGSVRGNYCTWNPLFKSPSLGNGTISNGNLTLSQSSAAYIRNNATIGMSSGKYYAEITVTSGGSIMGLGIATGAVNGGPETPNDYSYNATDGYKNVQTVRSPYGSSWTTSGDVIGLAFDADAGSLVCYKNGVSQGTLVSGLAADTYFFTAYLYAYDGPATKTLDLNAGQRAFAYTAPSGFKALCDTNLPAPVVAKPNTLFDIALWTGTGVGGRAVTGLNFNPDLVWLKRRSSGGSNSHQLHDVVRGASTGALYSDLTNAEDSNYPITSFDTAGFTLGSSASLASQSYASQNETSQTYVGWTWDAGTSTASNGSGSITSQVRANVSAGFSVVTATTPNSATGFTIGHGLNVAPEMIIVKQRNSTSSWAVYHKYLDTSPEGKYLLLDSTAAKASSSLFWNNTAPSSTVFSSYTNGVWGQNATLVAYCFAPVVGYSSFGSYTGNGSSDGPFVYTGMRPRWIMFKRTDSAVNWEIYDSQRNPYNPYGKVLSPNTSDAEADVASGYPADMLSNGFKIRHTGGAVNASAGTYIYAAFAESPFQYARAR